MLKSDLLRCRCIKKNCSSPTKMVTSLLVSLVKYDNRSLLQSTCLSWTLVIFEAHEECDIIKFNKLNLISCYSLIYLFINLKKRRQLLGFGLFFYVSIKVIEDVDTTGNSLTFFSRKCFVSNNGTRWIPPVNCHPSFRVNCLSQMSPNEFKNRLGYLKCFMLKGNAQSFQNTLFVFFHFSADFLKYCIELHWKQNFLET